MTIGLDQTMNIANTLEMRMLTVVRSDDDTLRNLIKVASLAITEVIMKNNEELERDIKSLIREAVEKSDK